MPRFVVVFDTNVLFSAIGWAGTPRRCLDLAQGGAMDAITCEPIMEELAAKLGRKLAFSDRQVLETTLHLMRFMRPVAITGTMTGLCADPKDDMVLECALAASATHVVSGDKKHLLALRQFRGIPIISPAELERVVAPGTP